MDGPGSSMVDATIFFGSTEVPCTVSSISKIGACLVVQSTHGIPDVFEFAERDRPTCTCKVVWRDGTRLGVYFR